MGAIVGNEPINTLLSATPPLASNIAISFCVAVDTLSILLLRLGIYTIFPVVSVAELYISVPVTLLLSTKLTLVKLLWDNIWYWIFTYWYSESI